MMDITLSVPRSETALIAELNSQPEFQADVIEGAGFDGSNELVTVMLSVTTASLTALVAALRAYWQRTRHTSIEVGAVTVRTPQLVIEVGGMKITGISPDQVESTLRQMLEARVPGNSR